MTRTVLKYGILAVFLIAISPAMRAQGFAGKQSAESVAVFTDRTLYITGESIHFSAQVIENMPGTGLSSILYCELITAEGVGIASGKYIVENSSAGGSLVIPGGAITGYYYLKSYTKWMRNGGPLGYNYVLLKIINPYKTDVISGKDTIDSAHFIINEWDKQKINITPDKMVYRQGEEARIKIDCGMINDFKGKMAVSVVPAASWDSISVRRDSISVHRDSIRQWADSVSAETRGISLSGRLLEEKSGNPLPNALVNLSIIGDKDVMAIRTDTAGRFNFALPGYTGRRDIFLCSEDQTDKPVKLLVDNDFCQEATRLPSPLFRLSETEKEAALKMAANQKICTLFMHGETVTDSLPGSNDRPFYGKPDEILEMGKYIDLPTIEDYFSELLGSVNVRKFEGRKIFRFNSNRTEMLIFDPLVMIDWVAVNDIDKILAMSPRQIRQIELINAPYVKGNITYGGIISFISKNNDFAGIDLPASGTFINYQFLAGNDNGIQNPHTGENFPDSRNTVYWNPELQLNDEGIAEIRFTAPETPGRYVIVVVGSGDAGSGFIDRKEFLVKN
jgi:hypothetical protein